MKVCLLLTLSLADYAFGQSLESEQCSRHDGEKGACADGLFCGYHYVSGEWLCCESIAEGTADCVNQSEIGEPCGSSDDACRGEDVVCHKSGLGRTCKKVGDLLDANESCLPPPQDFCRREKSCGLYGHSGSLQQRCCPGPSSGRFDAGLGLCSNLTLDEPCSTNKACNSGYCENCRYGRLCQNGTCAVDVTLGEQCETKNDCSSSRCAFDEADPAVRTKVCCPRPDEEWGNDPYCRWSSPVGKTCITNHHCASNYCINGFCVAGQSAEGGSCDEYTDCILPFQCGFNSTDGTTKMCCRRTRNSREYCPSISEAGMPCPGDDQCINSHCLLGTCTTELQDVDLACDSDKDCKNSACGRTQYNISIPGKVCCESGKQINGFCTSLVENGDTCLNGVDAYCRSGICLFGNCTIETLGDEAPCENNVDCESGICFRETRLIYNRTWCCPEGTGFWTYYLGNITYCGRNLPDGEVCEADNECISGNCFDEACTSSMEDDGSGGFGCFSAHTLVDVQGKGLISIKKLLIGDMVKSNANDWSRVYSLAHFSPSLVTPFLQIFMEGAATPLEVTKEHLLFLHDKVNPMPASSIRVGSKLVLGNQRMYEQGAQAGDPTTTVSEIRHIARKGMYGPLTNAGTLVVNNHTLVSTYVALRDDSPNFWIGPYDTGMNMHHICGLGVAPRRLLCYFRMEYCKREARNDVDGKATWITNLHNVTDWILQQFPPFVSAAVILPSVMVCFVVSMLLEPQWWVLMSMVVGWAWLNRRNSGSKS